MRVLVTGISGAGKSSALAGLADLGHRVVDTDTDQWSHWVTDTDGLPDWVWREDAITDLLEGHRGGALFVAGCKTNQGAFYPLFEHVALLSAPTAVLLERIDARVTNSYGRTDEERRSILLAIESVEPLLRSSATVVLDASRPLAEVVHALDELVRTVGSRPDTT